MLDNIIEQNSELLKIQNITEILRKIERIIPESDRENFYHNLLSLKIELSEDLDTSYVFNENKIIINTNFDKYLVGEWSAENKTEILQNMFESNLCHELLHMASTKKYSEVGLIHSGFQAIMPNGNILGNYLNEGFTEMISEVIYPSSYPYSDYKDTVHIASIISSLIGIENIKKLYFSNGLAINLQKQLANFANEKDLKILLTQIEALPYAKALNNQEFYNSSLYNIIYRGIKPTLKSTIDFGIKNNIFKTKEELDTYYNSYIKPNIYSLLEILKNNNFDFNSELYLDEIAEFDIEHFTDNFSFNPQQFENSNSMHLGFIAIKSIITVLSITTIGIILAIVITNLIK